MKSKQTLLETKLILHNAQDKILELEILLAHAINGAPVAEKGEWRVLIRLSPRYVTERDYMKVAIFQHIQGEWKLWAYGSASKLNDIIRSKCDSSTDAGKEYLILAETFDAAIMDIIKQSTVFKDDRTKEQKEYDHASQVRQMMQDGA
jgi:hypothetical protein